jgi:hypothetical protein
MYPLKAADLISAPIVAFLPDGDDHNNFSKFEHPNSNLVLHNFCMALSKEFILQVYGMDSHIKSGPRPIGSWDLDTVNITTTNYIVELPNAHAPT